LQVFVEQVGEERRPRALWRLVVQFSIFAVASVLFTVPLASLLYLFRTAGVAPGGAGGLELSPGSPALVPLSGAASLLAVLLSLWLAGRYLDKRPIRDFGLRINGGWWLDLGFGLALGAVLMTAVFLVQAGAGWVSVAGTYRSTVPDLPFSQAILIPAFAFLCIGVYEELLSRSYQLQNIAEGLNYPALGPKGAISSAFFGALHAVNPNATLISTTNIALAGIMLGAGYVLTGQLAIPIGLHITWNFFQGNVFGFPVSGIETIGATFVETEQSGPALWTGGAFGPEAGLIGISAMLLGILLTLLWIRACTGKVGLHTPLSERPGTTDRLTRT
jgi:membrane protease YdiL (CAAX protease family)